MSFSGLVLLLLAAVAESTARPILVVHINNYAKVVPSTLAAAETRAARLFHNAGVEVAWLHCPITTADARRVPACQTSDVMNVMVRIIAHAETSPTLGEHMLGFAVPAPGGGIYTAVVYDRVRRMARARLASEAEILGCAIAHEVGHLLLGSEPHAAAGLMRAEWNPAELKLASVEQLRFTPRQAALMSAELDRRASAVPSDSLHTSVRPPPKPLRTAGASESRPAR